MAERNKSGEISFVSADPNGAMKPETIANRRDREKAILDAMNPAQRRFYVSPAGTRTPASVVNKPTREIPATPGASKPTRELPAETLAFLKECCK